LEKESGNLKNKECNPRTSPNWMLGWKMTPLPSAKQLMCERIRCAGIPNGCDSSCTKKSEAVLHDTKDLKNASFL
jgi:hypothetical protein